MKPIRNVKRTYDKAGRRFREYKGDGPKDASTGLPSNVHADYDYAEAATRNAVTKAIKKNEITDEMYESVVGNEIKKRAQERLGYYTDDILEMRAKGYDTSEYELVAPEYLSFCNKMGLNPNEAASAAQFIQRQSRSTRAIVDIEDPVKADEVLTTATNSRGDRLGGDQLETNGGLYTSNSGGVKNTKENPYEDTVPNRFSTSLFSKESRGTVADLHTDFGIDPNLSPMEQIKAFKDKQIDGNMLQSLFHSYLGGGRKHGVRTKTYDAEQDLKAVYGPYFEGGINERVLVTKLPEEKVATIVDKTNTERVGDRTSLFNRYGATDGGYNFEHGSFLPYNEAFTPETIKRYVRYIKENPSLKDTPGSAIDASTELFKLDRFLPYIDKYVATGAANGVNWAQVPREQFSALMQPVKDRAWKESLGKLSKRDKLESKILDGEGGFAYKLFELLNPSVVKNARSLGKKSSMEKILDDFGTNEAPRVEFDYLKELYPELSTVYHL
jgi:hypothetical protein